jgi:hypothetical protein
MEREWRNRCDQNGFSLWKSFESAAKKSHCSIYFLWASRWKGIRDPRIFYFSNQWNLLNLRRKNKTPNNTSLISSELKLCKQNEVVPAFGNRWRSIAFIKSFSEVLSYGCNIFITRNDGCIADLLCTNNCFSPNMFFPDWNEWCFCEVALWFLFFF